MRYQKFNGTFVEQFTLMFSGKSKVFDTLEKLYAFVKKCSLTNENCRILHTVKNENTNRLVCQTWLTVWN